MLLPDRKTRMALGPYLPNLAGYWSSRRGPVPQTGTMLDLSGRGNHGTCNGNAHAIPGEGMQFDGTGDYVDVARDETLEPNYITLSTWVYSNVLKDWSRIINKGIVDPPYRGYSFLVGETNILLQFNIGGTLQQIIVEHNMNISTWYYITATFDGSTIRIYNNGRPLGNPSSYGGIMSHNTAEPLYIGISSKGIQQHNGQIDEVMIHNVALPAANIRALYETQRHLFGV